MTGFVVQGHKYILICVQKMNEGLTGLEQHEDE